MTHTILVAMQHSLSEAQVSELTKEGGEIRLLKDVDSVLFSAMANSPSEVTGSEGLGVNASSLKRLARGFDALLLPLGSPAQMFMVARGLDKGTKVLFAHSERVSTETAGPDGSVVKKTIFKHLKFIEIVC